MAALHVSESEAIRELPRLLAQVEQGDEVIIERDDAPVAVLTKARVATRSFEETVGRLRESARVNVDDAFAADVQSAIDAHREPHDYPAWD
jgi:antitoxin (DNA-binding transcriptional repressor) of toxin-antitoxin stability system